MTKRQTAVAFFREHAGYSVAPGETEAQGRTRSAKEYAGAEAWLMAQPGFTVHWEQDEEYNPKDYDVPDMPEIGWVCIVTANGETETLCGVTFDDDGYPDGNAYARVVVAELALQLMGE